jgi:hypothetical protein
MISVKERGKKPVGGGKAGVARGLGEKSKLVFCSLYSNLDHPYLPVLFGPLASVPFPPRSLFERMQHN